MIPALVNLFLAALVQASSDPEPAASLLVHGPAGFEPLRGEALDQPIVLPLLTRSEREQRAVRTQRGIGLRIRGEWTPARLAERLSIARIAHGTDERIAVSWRGELVKLAGERLPRSVTLPGSDAEMSPWTARADGCGIPSQCRVDVGVQGSEEALVQVLCDDEPWYARVGPPGEGPHGVAHEAEDAAREDRFVDHITLARAILLGTGDLTAVALPDEANLVDGFTELWLELPDPGAGAPATTLVLRTDFPVQRHVPRRGASAAALFRDVSPAAGIDMVHMEGPDLQLDIRPTMGPGAAWGDVDGDGWVDLFLPQGGGREGTRVASSRLYRNRGDGTFADESEARGLALEGAGMGALFFDADGDRDLDLFVANYGRNRFLLNDGSGHFTDVSGAVGLATDRWHAAVSAADYDGDGDLDLYVTSYLRYDESQMPEAGELGRYQREDPIAMLPFAFPGEAKSLLRNDHVAAREASTKDPPSFRFTDVAKESGLADEGGRGMQAVFLDFDRDGDPDLYLANDVSPNRFWRNDGGGKWKDIGFSTGVDDPRGSMGLAVGDVEGDGDPDLFVTNWQLEANALYVNSLVNKTSARSRVATFRDVAVQAGVGAPSVGFTKWGVELADFDLDLDLDLVYANGYTSPDYESTGICVGQPSHYFENVGEGRFAPAFERAGSDLARPLASRCLLACDYDQDGDLDFVVTANNGRARLFRNELEHGRRHWLGVRLVAQGANPFGIGAEVEIVVGGRTLRRSVFAGTSYLGGNAPELHFGLGENAGVSACRVRWPGGRTTTHAIAGVDRFVTLEEP